MATEYVVSGTLLHGGVEHADGSLFSTEDAALEAQLVRSGALLTLEQYHRQAEANADVPALQRALALRDQQATVSAEKDARIAELEQKLAQQEADKSGEDGSSGDSGDSEGSGTAESQPSEDNA